MIISLRNIGKLLFPLILFLYFFPIDFQAIPISGHRICQLAGLILVILVYKWKFPRIIINIVLIAISVFLIGLFSSSILNGTDDISFALIRGPYVIFYLSYSFLIVFIFKKIYNAPSLYLLMELCIYISLIYGLISIVFFIVPDTLYWYKSLIVLIEDVDAKIDIISAFRLFGASQNMGYANAAVHMGVVMWIAILLHKEKFGFLKRKLFYYFVISFLSVVGVLFARTYFVMLALTIVYLYMLNAFKLCDTFIDAVKMYMPIIFLGMLSLFYLISTNEEAVNWLFELFVNFLAGDGFTSDSTNELQNMIVFPNNLKTWLFGDGLAFTSTNGFYMNTDIGYLRSLFYWGIIGSLIYYGGIIIIYRMLKKRIVSDAGLKVLFFMVLVWFGIYNMKEFWSPVPYFVLFLVAAVLLPVRVHDEICHYM